MSIITLINQNIFPVAIILIVCFIIYFLYSAFKNSKTSETKKEETPTGKPKDETSDNPVKRMSRGLKVMYDKIAESDYVKGMQEEQANAKFDDMMPKEFMNEEKQEDVFSMDLSKITKTDI